MPGDGKVLYRVWRPLRFREVVGQEHVTRALRNALLRDRLAHAYIFSGPRGTGKTTIARIVARAVNCLYPVDGEPCGQCEPCKQIPRGAFPDVLELDAASNRGIDEVRGLRDQARYAPIEGRMKVYIVDEVHMLTPEAANALLKTLEEPPPRLLFLLCTTDPQRLPATVLSRCQRFEMRRLRDDEITGRLLEVAAGEGFELTPAAAHRLARHAQGALRDGLSLLEQCRAFADGPISEQLVLEMLGSVAEEELSLIGQAASAEDVSAALSWVEHQVAAGRDPRLLAVALRDLWYEWLRVVAGVDEQPSVVPPAGWGVHRIASGLDRWITCVRQTRTLDDPRVALEVALAELIAPPEGIDRLAELEARLQRLEMGTTREVSGARQGPPTLAGPSGDLQATPTLSKVRVQAAAGVAPDVLETILRELHHRRATSTAAYLAEAHLVSAAPDEVRVRFPSRFSLHFEQVQRPEHRHAVEEVLTDIIGGAPRLRVELEKGGDEE